MVRDLHITVKDVPADRFISEFSKYLKSQKLSVPESVEYVKTSIAREMCPTDPDWYYVRCAAVARRVYMNTNTGVGKLTKIFGTAHRRGCKGSVHQDAARGVIRRALQSLEKLKIVEKGSETDGRHVSKSGRLIMNQIAEKVQRDMPPVIELI